MNAKPHTFSSLLAAIVLAGGLSAVQAQTAAPDTPPMQAPSAEPAPPSATQPSPGMPGTPPSGAAGQGTMEIDPDEARAIMQARQMCSKAADPQAQQDCMNQAQQDYYRARSGSGGAGDSGGVQPESPMDPGSPTAPGGAGPSDPSAPSGSSGQMPR